jgi:hypothetical protein
MAARLRVGLLAYGLERPISGVSRVALELGRALLERPDCQVTFLTPYRRGPFAGEPGVRRVYLPGCRLLPGLMLLGGPMIALAARALDLDVVHVVRVRERLERLVLGVPLLVASALILFRHVSLREACTA